MILDDFKLDGKVALVTGAGQGLGQAMAIGLAEAGADIVGLDRGGSETTAEIVIGMGRNTSRLFAIYCMPVWKF